MGFKITRGAGQMARYKEMLEKKGAALEAFVSDDKNRFNVSILETLTNTYREKGRKLFDDTVKYLHEGDLSGTPFADELLKLEYDREEFGRTVMGMAAIVLRSVDDGRQPPLPSVN